MYVIFGISTKNFGFEHSFKLDDVFKDALLKHAY